MVSSQPFARPYHWLAFYFTKSFKDDKWAIHYYASIQGHELVTRRDLIPSEPDHPRAGQWYYAFQLGPLEHKLPLIASHRWRRVTFVVTTSDRFMNAHEINDLFEQESPVGQLYVRLKELGITVEREWWIDEEGTAYVVDLALPVEEGWLPETFGDRPGPAGGLRFGAEAKVDANLREIQSGCVPWKPDFLLRRHFHLSRPASPISVQKWWQRKMFTFVRESHAGHPQVRLRDIDIPIKREWPTALSSVASGARNRRYSPQANLDFTDMVAPKEARPLRRVVSRIRARQGISQCAGRYWRRPPTRHTRCHSYA